MKIAHISDLHIGLSDWQDRNSEKILNRIATYGVDHLVITGDLTAFGEESQYEKAVKLLSQFDFFSSERLTVIPGNHDLFNHILQYFHSAIDLLKRFYKLPAAMKKIFSFSILDYNKELQKFSDFLQNSFKNTIRKNDQASSYPFAKILSDEIALIGIDSNKAIGVLENQGASNGVVFVDKLKGFLDDPSLNDKKKIVLMHHYLHSEEEMARVNGRYFSKYMRLLNRQQVTQLFLDHHVDLVLHGHYHTNQEYWIERQLRVLNGGGSYRGPFWNLIDVRNDNIVTKIKNCKY